ncbi:hypothetical protein CYMTET_19035 [Cymbomonas tetramitiformis]|uniref:Prolyl 4-hydroxylase alpha subunit domain-containing protein n=1 Tax=Cymbomonas tetramitiformis TaxID=36881 RepID=A0AAE0G782_9CHLO|nr:hypothetical protein CYMTET_19035 [Cymbomonas tetramitiformis]
MHRGNVTSRSANAKSAPLRLANSFRTPEAFSNTESRLLVSQDLRHKDRPSARVRNRNPSFLHLIQGAIAGMIFLAVVLLTSACSLYGTTAFFARLSSFHLGALPAIGLEGLPTDSNSSATLFRGFQSALLRAESPYVRAVQNLLSPEECRHLISLAGPGGAQLEASGSRDQALGGAQRLVQYLFPARTSRGLWLSRASLGGAELDAVAAVRDRAWQLTGLSDGYGEELYLIRYQKGEHYAPHFDWLGCPCLGARVDVTNPRGPRLHGLGRKSAGGRKPPSNDRAATMIVFLSDVEGFADAGEWIGGETLFPVAGGGGFAVRPRAGDALLWMNCKLNGTSGAAFDPPTLALGNHASIRQRCAGKDPHSLHAGAPILRGEKWILTLWIYQHPLGK